jgi:hypothetical protein
MNEGFLDDSTWTICPMRNEEMDALPRAPPLLPPAFCCSRRRLIYYGGGCATSTETVVSVRSQHEGLNVHTDTLWSNCHGRWMLC